MPTSLAYVISSHGYGHATRAAAVMNAIQQHEPDCHFHIFTNVPEALFRESLTGPHTHHPMATDVGVVQQSALREDLPTTVQRLAAFYPPAQTAIDGLSAAIRHHDCRLVLCDIAPIGILAARAAARPSVLIENFLWDFIYTGYATAEPRLHAFIPYLRECFEQADHHIQTEPVCTPTAADLTVCPVSRQPRVAAATLRHRLGLRDVRPLILITMGGIEEDAPFLQRLSHYPDFMFVAPGTDAQAQRTANLLTLPRHSGVYHPDLVHAADVVIGKLGYSTLAEVYHAGLPFGYVMRAGFVESQALAAFVNTHMRGLAITPDEYREGTWLDQLETLTAAARLPGTRPNGADAIADFLQ